MRECSACKQWFLDEHTFWEHVCHSKTPTPAAPSQPCSYSEPPPKPDTTTISESVCAEADIIKKAMKAECRKIVEAILIEEGCVCPKEEGKIIKHLPECPLLGGCEETVCEEADRIINGERRSDYGPVEKSFQDYAAMWSVVFKCSVTPTQVALAMACLKICRELNGHKRDSVVDAIGYLALVQRIEEGKSI